MAAVCGQSAGTCADLTRRRTCQILHLQGEPEVPAVRRRRLHHRGEAPLRIGRGEGGPVQATNHTGITCGAPPRPTVASLAVRLPCARNSRISVCVISRDMDPGTLSLLSPYG